MASVCQEANDCPRDESNHDGRTERNSSERYSNGHRQSGLRSSRRFSLHDALRVSAAFWNPRFDSEELEKEYRQYMFTYQQQLFRYGLVYMFVATLVWMTYFAVELKKADDGRLGKADDGSNCLDMYNDVYNAKVGMQVFVSGAGGLCLCILAMFLFTLWSGYRQWWRWVNAGYAMSLCVAQVVMTWIFNKYFPHYSVQSIDSWPLQLMVVLYGFCPVYLPLLLGISVIWLVAHTTVAHFTAPYTENIGTNGSLIAGNQAFIVFLLGIVLVHLHLQNERNQHSIFWKTGQSLLAKHGLQIEKRLKQQVILSVVPRMVAADLLDPGESQVARSSSQTFRPLTMSKMDNVSILFADIVGFTKLSAKKTADQVVGLLNDLFGRFDQLVDRMGCEKISTLGDCYYCVSGCPEPRDDHANCCVDMGLAMIDVIAEFCADTGEDVNMRVGVHTGTVLCGVIGTKRIKFDVWSSDVTLANKLETGGSPGCVHVSQQTVDFLDRRHYTIIPHTSVHPDLQGVTTFLVTGSRSPTSLRRKRSWHDHLNLIPDSPLASCESKPNSSLPNHQLSNIQPPSEQAGVIDRRASVLSIFGRRMSLSWIFGLGVSQLSFNRVTIQQHDDDRDKLCTVFPRRGDSIGEILKSQNYSRDSQHVLIQQIQEKAQSLDSMQELPVNWWTLSFNDPELETSYRKMLSGDTSEDSRVESLSMLNSSSNEETTSNRGFHFMLYRPKIGNVHQMSDPVVSFIAFMGISIVCFVGLNITHAFLAVFISMLVLTSLLLGVTLASSAVTVFLRLMPKVKKVTSTLSFRHAEGLFMVMTPAALIYSTFDRTSEGTWGHIRDYSISVSAEVFCIILCCNFSQLFWYVRAPLALTLSVALQVYVYYHAPSHVPGCDNTTETSQNAKDIFVNAGVHIDMACLLLLVCIVCRMYEVTFRLTAKASLDAAAEKSHEALLHDQAQRLLLNIFPDHVLGCLRATCEVSFNYERVGVIFASISNFNDFYSEKYEHGRECIRVLNELISDFDDLLDRPRYKYIDKIKTVGNTYMAASGLNRELQQSYQNPDIHLRGMVNFALEMHNLVESFNYNTFGFKFVLRVGFNAGPVTAGVVGSTKQLYDIWGDTVNISSRMESTGVGGKIQMTKPCSDALSAYFVFEKRGTVFVKGVGDTETYLVVGRV